MALSHRPVARSRPVRAVRRKLPVVRTFLAGAATAVSYIGLAGSAFGPASEPLGTLGLPEVPVVQATLSYSGADPIITGSVSHLFDSISFTGPNRAAKTDRQRPAKDPLAISRSFEEVRTKLAALRAPPSDPTDLGQTRVADLDAPDEAEEAGPRMSVASIDPKLGAGALDAIAGIAPSSAPVPDVPSGQLAYARVTTPAIGDLPTEEAKKVSDRELWCLATAIYFEARGEAYRGQVAVAQVVLNRVADHRYPDTICGVVFQNQHKRNACQFSFACDGIPEVVNEPKPWAQAEEIALGVTRGDLHLAEVGTATHYHATYVRPDWSRRMNKVTQIGLHVFYKFKSGWLFG
jgi:hypothetical protein